MSETVKFLFILFVQGSGPSSSVPLPVASYPTMEACISALEYEKAHDRLSWTVWSCAPIALPEGAVLLIPGAK